jgi:hypothetical protein
MLTTENAETAEKIYAVSAFFALSAVKRFYFATGWRRTVLSFSGAALRGSPR